MKNSTRKSRLDHNKGGTSYPPARKPSVASRLRGPIVGMVGVTVVIGYLAFSLNAVADPSAPASGSAGPSSAPAQPTYDATANVDCPSGNTTVTATATNELPGAPLNTFVFIGSTEVASNGFNFVDQNGDYSATVSFKLPSGTKSIEVKLTGPVNRRPVYLDKTISVTSCPVTTPPVSTPPVSSPPVSTPPVSTPPVSVPPVTSAPPSSSPPIKTSSAPKPPKSTPVSKPTSSASSSQAIAPPAGPHHRITTPRSATSSAVGAPVGETSDSNQSGVNPLVYVLIVVLLGGGALVLVVRKPGKPRHSGGTQG